MLGITQDIYEELMMMTFKDKTFCGSPNCDNNCGRKMTTEEKDLYDSLDYKPPVSYSYFCEGVTS